MTGYLLDTNVIGELSPSGASRRVRAWIAARSPEDLFISLLTVAEYSKGIANTPVTHPSRALYVRSRDELRAQFGPRVLSVDDDVVQRWGTISGEVKVKTKHFPPVIDTLLAATAIEHGLTLVTRNIRDVQHSGAALLNPWTEG